VLILWSGRVRPVVEARVDEPSVQGQQRGRGDLLSDADISAHPELKLARWAARELEPATAATTTVYTSCQPCGMCT
jgi:tRNA(Arg) A34 adenosine deaminase TadA